MPSGATQGHLLKILWHDGLGCSLYAKRLERGRFPVAVAGGRRRGDHACAARLPAGGDRLEEPAADLASTGGRMTRNLQRLSRDFDIFGASCTVEVMEDTPEDVEGLRRPCRARAEAAAARAIASSTEAVIAALKLEVLKLRRELYGQRSERRVRLLEQMELQLEELEATASEDELAAEQAAARASTPVRAFERRRPVRKRSPNICRASGGDRGADDVRLLRLRADREARRGRHRDWKSSRASGR